MNFKILLSLIIISVVLVSGCTIQPTQEKFRIGFIPSEMAEEVNPKAEAIGDFLEEKMGMKVEVIVPTAYETLIEGLRFENLDAIYTDGGAGWLAHKKTGAQVVLAEKRSSGLTYYNAVVFVRNDSDITSFNEVAGKKIAFTSWTGSSGFVMPVGTLVDRGIINPAGKDFASLESAIAKTFETYTVSGGYSQSLNLLIDGKVDVVGGADDAPERFLEQEDIGKLKQLEVLGKVPSHPILIGKHVDIETKNKFVSAMLELNKEENKQLLIDIYGIDGLQETTTQEHLSDFGIAVDALVGLQDKLLE